MRHTWATLAAELDIPKETISAALGHGKKTVTDIYIQFDRKKIDEANRKVISHVFYNRTELLKEAKLKYNAYDPEDWTKAYFDKISGGFNVYHKDHNFSKKGGGGKAEKIVGKMLARHNAKQVEFLPESGYQKSPDINFDTQTWDIKYIDNANIKTIRSYIEIIRRKECQGIFYWEKEEKIQDLKSAMESEIGKLSKLGRMSEMPDIYYMNKNKILTLLWGKK
jgi:hypothetical protein